MVASHLDIHAVDHLQSLPLFGLSCFLTANRTAGSGGVQSQYQTPSRNDPFSTELPLPSRGFPLYGGMVLCDAVLGFFAGWRRGGASRCHT